MIRKKKKVRLRKKLGNLLLILIIISIGSIILLQLKNKDNDVLKEPINNNENITQEEQIQNKEEIYELSLIMVGDMLVHDDLYNEAKKLSNNNGYDFKPMLTYVKDIVKNYDLAYYNQETILGGTEIGLSSYPSFNSPYEVGDAMIDAGFNIVSLATNHTLDRGIKAIENSHNYWKNKDTYVTGSYSTMEERNNIEIKEKNNITYAVLNYTYGTNGVKRPNGYESYVNIWDMSNKTNYESYKEQVKTDIESVRDKVDVLMVAMHWGTEYKFDTTWYQEDCAKFLSDQGVDIIIGTHPHVVGPVTWINDTLVIYSLGNFLSAHEVVNIANRIGLMTMIDIKKEVRDNETIITLENLNNELIYTYHNNYKDFKVIPFSSSDIHNYLNNSQNIYEDYKKIVTELDENIKVKEIAIN